MIQNHKYNMTAEDVVEFMRLFNQNQIDACIDGGWGVDALLGEQTRLHEDLDVVIPYKEVNRLRELLETQGFKDVPRPGTRECNFLMGDNQGHLIDIHTISFDPVSHPEYGIDYSAEALNGIGNINGYPVKCIALEWMVKYHTGYTLDEKDYHDVEALCQRYGITMPSEYEDFQVTRVKSEPKE